MAFRYPQPDNEGGFEQLCLRFYRKLWKNENLKLYGKRGEEQFGVDIFDPLGIEPRRAVQCKHHEPTKTIPQAEIKAEVAKAETFPFQIDHFVIATTAKKSRNAQDTVAKLNNRPDRKFTVDVYFWEDICQQVNEFGRVFAEIVIYGENVLAGALPLPSSRDRASRGLPDLVSTEDSLGDEPYASIEKLLNERQLDIARHELRKLPDVDELPSLPCDQQYKLFRLRAKLALEAGDFDIAGELFLQAFAVAPESDQAKQNQVLAFILRGDFLHAYATATRYIAEGLTTPVMVLRLLDSITSRDQLAEHAPLFDAFIDSDESINTVLAQKFISFGDYGAALKSAERALVVSPDSPHAHLVAALSMHNLAVHGDMEVRISRLRLAIEHYDTAERAAREQRFCNVLPEVLVNRAAAKMLLGNNAGAADDYRDAVASAVSPSIYAVPAIAFLLNNEDFDSARDLLKFLDRSTRDAQYLALVAEYHAADAAADRREQISRMQLLAEQDWERAAECRFQCVQWALHLDDYQLAESFVDTEFEQNHPFQAHTMLAWIHAKAQDRDCAKQEAAKALDESIRTAHPQELRLLASILVNLGQDADAISLLQQVAKPGVLDDDMKSLIVCAQRFDRHDLLLRICRELRESGVHDEQLMKLEVQLLSEYLPLEALTLADEFVHYSIAPSYFVAYGNFLAVRLKQLDRVNPDPASVPQPAELVLGEACLILLPYVATGRYDDALRFLFAQRRLFFEEERAHGNYVSFFLRYGHQTRLRDPPAIVSGDSAVLLETNRGGPRWVIIEDDHPAASRGEIAVGSQLGQILINRQTGDVVELPGNPLQSETATIREIQSKYVRAFQDSLENFRKMFPESSVLQQLDVGDEESFDPTIIIKSLQGRRNHVERCLAIYREHACGLYLFARRIGVNERDALKALASHANGVVKCRQIMPPEFEQAVRNGIGSNCVVLTISAIVTISLVEGWRFLDETKQYLISQLTSELIDEWIADAGDVRAKEGGVVSLDAADKLMFFETTDEDREVRLEELSAIRNHVDRHCTIGTSLAVAEMVPTKRRLYTELIGIHNIEAMSLAKDRQAVLWTDDAVVGIVGSADFGTNNIWTQLAFRCFVESGSISKQEFDLVTAKLAAWNYVSIIWKADTLIAASAEAGWKTDTWPLSRCLALLANRELHVAVRMHIVIEFLRLLRRSDCPELMQGPLIRAALDALGSPRAVRQILRGIDQVFTVDIPSAELVRLELLFWLRLR